VLLVSIPALQWLVLRRVIRQALWWIPVNAGAWAAGILWTLAPSPFIDEDTAFPVHLGSYFLAGMLMAATVAALKGVRRATRGALHCRPGKGWRCQRVRLAGNGLALPAIRWEPEPRQGEMNPKFSP
jgi:hypothetical protein